MNINIFWYCEKGGAHRGLVAPPYFCITAEGNKVSTSARGPLSGCVPVSACPSVQVSVGREGLYYGGWAVPVVFATACGTAWDGSTALDRTWPGVALRGTWHSTVWHVAWHGMWHSTVAHGTRWDVAHGTAQDVAHRGVAHGAARCSTRQCGARHVTRQGVASHGMIWHCQACAMPRRGTTPHGTMRTCHTALCGKQPGTAAGTGRAITAAKPERHVPAAWLGPLWGDQATLLPPVPLSQKS